MFQVIGQREAAEQIVVGFPCLIAIDTNAPPSCSCMQVTKGCDLETRWQILLWSCTCGTIYLWNNLPVEQIYLWNNLPVEQSTCGTIYLWNNLPVEQSTCGTICA